MKRYIFIIVTMIVPLFFYRYADAQAVKSEGKPLQAYVGIGNDMQYYEILYKKTNEKDYAAYSQVIREKIKEKLKSTYQYYQGEGDVNLAFSLKSDGSLSSFAIDPNSIKNEKLRDIAALSLKKASPFPAFPKTLSFEEMFFSVDISFQKKWTD